MDSVKQIQVETNNSNTNNGLNGSKWFEICKACQEEVEECCRDLQMTLFPDELEQFSKHDPKHVKKYKDGTYGYETKRCIFLLPTNECELQKTGRQKPLDCIIYPMSFKNGKVFLDRSCWAKRLLDVEKAYELVTKKITKYPHYVNVQYLIRNTDIYLKDIEIITEKKN